MILALLAAVPALALEERLVVRAVPGAVSPEAAAPGSALILGDWRARGAILGPGLKGGEGYALARAAYEAEAATDLLVHLDSEPPTDAARRWTLRPGPAYRLDRERGFIGKAAASFSGPATGISALPGAQALFARGSRLGDFTIEFWIYPANAENGEELLSWQSIRALPSGPLSQSISCVIAGGRLLWNFSGFFSRNSAAEAYARPLVVELRARSALVPRTWSHHLVRFDSDTGLFEYLVNGRPEAMTYVTITGREGSEVMCPAIGAAAPIRFFPEYTGLAQELRISRSFVERPALKPYGPGSALLVSPLVDLGFGNSRLVSIGAEYKTPGSTGIEFSYLIADRLSGRESADSPDWQPLRLDERLPDSVRGRYLLIRAELFADGTGLSSPSLSSIEIRYEPDPPPPPPATLVAMSRNGAIELRWSRVPESDLGGYLLYYGDAPGEYFGTGAAQGPSPIDLGNCSSAILSGIANGRLLYVVIAAYDKAASVYGAQNRAGDFSKEVSARAMRTAP